MCHLIANKSQTFSKICQRLQKCKSYIKLSEVTQKYEVSTIVHCRLVIVKVQKSNIFKVCVQNILHVLECKFEDVKVTA